MEELTLTVKEIGTNEFNILRNMLNTFVKQNFDLLYEGACRLGHNISADYYAPRRIQINDTRLHKGQSLKYADGHKYDSEVSISAEQLRQTVKDLQTLIDSASEEIKAPFIIQIVSK